MERINLIHACNFSMVTPKPSLRGVRDEAIWDLEPLMFSSVATHTTFLNP